MSQEEYARQLEFDLKDAINRCYLLERELEVEQRRADRADELLASCREISAQRAEELMILRAAITKRLKHGHNDTCDKCILPGEGYACSCGHDDLEGLGE